MSELFQAVEVAEGIYWVGAIDWDIRDFHGYATLRGTTYNAYLVMADQVTLMDTVKAPYGPEMMSRIRSVIDPKKIDVIVSNHSEMDHSGYLPQAYAAMEPKQIVASIMGEKALRAHFAGQPFLERLRSAKDGEELSLGNKTLKFVEARMVHWPDSMFSYLVEDEVLFSNDAFGMHLATAERFVDEVPWGVVEQETAKYYANILMPLSKIIAKLLARMKELNLPIRLVATDHGPIWRKDIGRVVEMYERWSRRPASRKAVVVYDTMWHSTDAMARAVAEGIAAGGASPVMMSLKSSHRSDVATEVLEAGALLVGTPTLNNNMFPTVADAMTYLRGLKPTGLIGAAFGSYGWSGEGVKQVQEMLKEMGVELVGEATKTVYVPDEQALAQCRQLGQDVAERLMQRLEHFS